MLVIVGGNGFIGRHLSVLSDKCGVPATVVSPNPDPQFLATNAPSISSLSLAEFNGPQGDRLLSSQASGLVYLASRTIPSSNLVTPSDELAQNVTPAFDMFWRVSQLRPTIPIILLSSGGTVYGPNPRPQLVETDPLRPVSPYGVGKVLIEQCLRYCHDVSGQRYAILRASNPVGRWHRNTKQGLAMAVLRAISSGDPLDVYGNGSIVRDYIDADDLATAILTVVRSNHPLNDVWNIGSGTGVSILQMIDLIGQLAGKAPKLLFRPGRAIDVPRCVLDIGKIRRDFRWDPETPLRDTIGKLLAAIKSAPCDRH